MVYLGSRMEVGSVSRRCSCEESRESGDDAKSVERGASCNEKTNSVEEDCDGKGVICSVRLEWYRSRVCGRSRGSDRTRARSECGS